MELLRPAHNIPSSKVKNWKEIKDDATALRELVNRDSFNGYYSKAFAISHCQASEDPKWFFAIRKDAIDGDGKNIVKQIGSDIVINAEIVESGVPVQWKEACMSFPFRNPKNTKRFAEIKVRYQVPVFGLFLMWRTKRFKELVAFIFQHEQDHAVGKNIYGINNQEVK